MKLRTDRYGFRFQDGKIKNTATAFPEQSRGLYDHAGFQVTARCRDDRYTLPLDNIRMELRLE